MIPQHVLDHLELREGRVNRVYEDSEGHATAGVGHLLTEHELDSYHIGDPVSDELIDEWLRADSEKAWLASYNQAKGIDCLDLREALFHVCFQLGAGWFRIHKKTWAYLKAGEYQNAALEAADSLWNEQTPTRVIDFQIACLQQAIKRV